MSWREELAWCAGFYDGEGNSGLTTQSYPRLSIGQTEISTLERFQKATRVGAIYGPYKRPQQGWSSIYMYVANGSQEVQAVGAMLWEFLSQPKRDQLTNTLVLGKRTNRTRCRANLHVIDEVGRIDKRCGGCYKMKHPNTKMRVGP